MSDEKIEFKVTASFSGNLFNDQIATARWIGAEMATGLTFEAGTPTEEKTRTLEQLYTRLEDLCQQFVEEAMQRYIDEHHGWRK